MSEELTYQLSPIKPLGSSMFKKSLSKGSSTDRKKAPNRRIFSTTFDLSALSTPKTVSKRFISLNKDLSQYTMDKKKERLTRFTKRMEINCEVSRLTRKNIRYALKEKHESQLKLKFKRSEMCLNREVIFK